MMQSRNTTNWIPWLLLAIVLVGGWMMWPRQQALPLPAPTGGETARQLPGNHASRPLPPTETSRSRPDDQTQSRLPGFLPAEAHDTIALIQHGGPFHHRQDGAVFSNREGHLPQQPRGWYHEYTVETPGASNRGTRRIITGGNPSSEWYYTDDHYDSFRAFDPGQGE